MTKKISHRKTLFFELDQNSRHRQTLTWRQKNMLVQLAWTGPPAQARKLALAGTPAQPCFTHRQEKKNRHGFRRTPDVKLRFVSFNRFHGFNFGQIQLLRFVVVMVWSNSLGHLESVKWLFLLFCENKKYLKISVFCFLNDIIVGCQGLVQLGG